MNSAAPTIEARSPVRRITVAICTFNNASLLSRTLTSLRRLERPRDLELEILVVDNNCSDQTADVVAGHAAFFGDVLRRVQEPRQGLSHARNRALREGTGEVVGFVDDDVEVDPQWLAAIGRAFNDFGADVVGGKSYLILPGPPPPWLSARLQAALSRVDYGDQPVLNIQDDLFGLNYSVRRERALALGGFNTELGRAGHSLLSGEESDFSERVRRAQGVVAYEPRAVVGHVVPPARLKKRWFVRRSFMAGDTKFRCDLLAGGRPGLLKALEDLVRCAGSAARAMLCAPRQAALVFERQLAAVKAAGYLTAAVKRSSSGR